MMNEKRHSILTGVCLVLLVIGAAWWQDSTLSVDTYPHLTLVLTFLALFLVAWLLSLGKNKNPR
jgi:hypothetical protein